MLQQLLGQYLLFLFLNVAILLQPEVRKPRRLHPAFRVAIVQQIPFGKLLPILFLMHKNRRQLPALPFHLLHLLKLLLTFEQCRHLRRRVHHPGHHRIILNLHSLQFPLRTVITVKMFLPVLEILNLRVVLLAVIRIKQLYEQLVVRVADLV